MNSVVSIVDCRPGDVLAKDVYWKNILILPANTLLTETLIEKLKQTDVTNVTIALPRQEEQEIPHTVHPIEHFQLEYKENANVLKNVINDLAAGRELRVDRLSGVFDSVYQQISHNYWLMDCINSIRSADLYTYTHSLNVALYCGLIARWMRLPDQEIKDVIQAGVLHDMGKSQVPQEILNKKGKLTVEEFEAMKRHSVIGYRLVIRVPELKAEVCNAVLLHHERMDGNGYPFGLVGDEIPLYAKIIAVADVYDALTSERVYKKRITPFDTFREFQELGYDSFDPQVLLVFLENIANYYTGAKVRLNTGEVGEITTILPQYIDKPIVRVGDRILDLAGEPQYRIVEML